MQEIVTFELANKLKDIVYPQHLDDRRYAIGEGLRFEDFDSEEPTIKCGESYTIIPDVITDGDDIAAPTLSQVLDYLRCENIDAIFYVINNIIKKH